MPILLIVSPLPCNYTITVYLAGNAIYENSKYSWLLGVGLLFSAGGDVALELEDESPDQGYFIVGLGLFLIAHILYIWAFCCLKVAQPKTVSLIGMICVIYYTIIMTLLLPVVEKDMIVPVAIYGLAILGMLFTASSRFFGKSHITYTSRYSALLGALFFVVSDSILALNKFYTPIENAKRMVMVTYYLAQICIGMSSRYHHH